MNNQDGSIDNKHSHTDTSTDFGVAGGDSVVSTKHYMQASSMVPMQTWFLWSKARRNEYDQRKEALDKKEDERKEDDRLQNIKKARQESLSFVSAAMQRRHLLESTSSCATITQSPTDRIAVEERREMARRGGNRCKNRCIVEKDMSLEQWSALAQYWNHALFVRLRQLGMVTGFTGLLTSTVAIGTNHWSAHNVDGSGEFSGLWLMCSIANSTCTNIYSNFKAKNNHGDWQKAVTAVIIFGVLFQLLGVILTCLGSFVDYVPHKKYYYHSAGEVFVVAGFSVGAGLIVYPLAVEHNLQYIKHTFGYSFIICVLSAGLTMGSAFCMLFDDIFKHAVKERSYRFACCGRRKRKVKYSLPGALVPVR